MVVDLLNKRSQSKESLQDRVHVASLAQVGEPERQINQWYRINTKTCFLKWFESGLKVPAGAHPRQARSSSSRLCTPSISRVAFGLICSHLKFKLSTQPEEWDSREKLSGLLLRRLALDVCEAYEEGEDTLNSSSSVSAVEPSDHWAWLAHQFFLKYTLIWSDWTVWFCLSLLEMCFSSLNFLKDVETERKEEKQRCFIADVDESNRQDRKPCMVVTTVTSAMTFSLHSLSFGDQTSFSAVKAIRKRKQDLG